MPCYSLFSFVDLFQSFQINGSVLWYMLIIRVHFTTFFEIFLEVLSTENWAATKTIQFIITIHVRKSSCNKRQRSKYEKKDTWLHEWIQNKVNSMVVLHFCLRYSPMQFFLEYYKFNVTSKSMYIEERYNFKSVLLWIKACFFLGNPSNVIIYGTFQEMSECLVPCANISIN